MTIQQICFALVLAVAILLIRKRIIRISSNIRLGRRVAEGRNFRAQMMNMVLVALGQKKMFERPVPALLHFLIYAGFLIINIEVLEFIVDGLAGTHRAFLPYIAGAYPVLMNCFEFLALGVLLSCGIFLVRRNVLRLPRFWTREMTSWPRLDANLILITEILLMVAILTMNSTDQILQGRIPQHYPQTGFLLFSGLMIPKFSGFSDDTLVFIERFAWWFHIVGILGFAVYITYSKHLHIFMAFPNTYQASLLPKGRMNNMDVVTREVKSMLGIGKAEQGTTDPGRFGAKDINDLPRTGLLGAYACTECGRCTSECPANITGKLLSPRKIMMDVRDRMEEVGKSISNGGPGLEDGKALLGDYITSEEINACTSCNACVEACPVMINPLEIILELRRYVAMEESSSPASWNSMFQNIENNFAPWKFPPSDRFNWARASGEKE